ncbi:sodium-dependent transporter [Brevibacterium daeguense]|nr:sodium-dependent transporter [Brevibacterium daeguense]
MEDTVSMTTSSQREMFATRTAFIMAAIGSAIGLGNIWRFPYVAYDSGGGAFLIPYLVALLTAGIPILFFDYALGHRSRSSAPMAFRAFTRAAEPIGWFQTGIAFVIGIYYAVIIGWAGMYMIFSVTQAWGDNAESFFIGEFLQQSGEFGLSGDFVPGVLIPLIIVWVVTLGVLLLGVQRGISRFNLIFIPLLVVMFLILVVRALFLPGAFAGLDAFFTPDFAALADPAVWVAAYGQIFFSLSIAFGIMITYASYLKRRTNLSGSGLVVAFSNSSFEVLAGIGVFAALGFMAQASGVAVDEVVASGVGLAFISFPTLISQMPGGALFGILFFGSLVFAGMTSLISIVQVPVQSVAEKLDISNRTSLLIVGGLMAVISCLTMPTVTGLNVLDVVDAFANNIGVVGSAVVSLIVVAWLLRKLPVLRDHINATSSFKLGPTWMICLSVITPLVLGYMLISQIITLIQDGYGGMPKSFTNVFGWGMIALLIVVAIVLTLIPWPKRALRHTEDAIAASDAATASLAEQDRSGAGPAASTPRPEQTRTEGGQTL